MTGKGQNSGGSNMKKVQDVNLSYTRLKRSNLKVLCETCGGRLKSVRSGEYCCTKCGATEYDDFGKIRQFLDENGPASKEEISMATGVEREIIVEYIKEQRLEAVDKAHNNTCVICGAKILSGTMCAECAGTKGQGFSKGQVASGRMRSDIQRKTP